MICESWDLIWCRPKVRAYIEDKNHPGVIYMDWLEAWMTKQCKVPHVIQTPRLRFCISQCLRAEGYHRVSHAGKRWEMTHTEVGKARDDPDCPRSRSSEFSTTRGSA